MLSNRILNEIETIQRLEDEVLELKKIYEEMLRRKMKANDEEAKAMNNKTEAERMLNLEYANLKSMFEDEYHSKD